ncbi:MAG: patatin-like phospholipase family protein [Oscillospiraceae bacterium]|nr:patatin-like phospholipase family protein [Oscillospiraceae bacterium]
MQLSKARIGLSLSGGGMRAAIFHLGALKYMAQAGLLERVVSISSVSGASLCIGAILAANGNKWPSGERFYRETLPAVRQIILGHDIQRAALLRLVFSSRFWLHSRVLLIAKALEDNWGIAGTMQDLPAHPYWEINCTTFETGGRFRIRRDYMGDQAIGFTQRPTLRASHMMAASAGFPILIGPYGLETAGMRWTKDKWGLAGEVEVAPRYALWDGGVYDNLGLEALYKIGRGLDNEIDFLIISNASAPIAYQERRRDISLHNTARLLDIAMHQVDALRSREVYASVISRGKGMYLKIGKSAGAIAGAFGLSPSQARMLSADCLSPEETALVRDYPTTLRTPSPTDFDLILRHGFESAKCVHLFGEVAGRHVYKV